MDRRRRGSCPAEQRSPCRPIASSFDLHGVSRHVPHFQLCNGRRHSRCVRGIGGLYDFTGARAGPHRAAAPGTVRADRSGYGRVRSHTGIRGRYRQAERGDRCLSASRRQNRLGGSGIPKRRPGGGGQDDLPHRRSGLPLELWRGSLRCNYGWVGGQSSPITPQRGSGRDLAKSPCRGGGARSRRPRRGRFQSARAGARRSGRACPTAGSTPVST